MNISYKDIVNGTPLEMAQVRVLNRLTREELRRLAITLGVKRGQNKEDTILNLVQSGKFEVRLSPTSPAVIEMGPGPHPFRFVCHSCVE